jgi:hypothetical protein
MGRPLWLAVQQRYRGGGRMEVSVRNSLLNFASASPRGVCLRARISATNNDSLADSGAANILALAQGFLLSARLRFGTRQRSQ